MPVSVLRPRLLTLEAEVYSIYYRGIQLVMMAKERALNR